MVLYLRHNLEEQMAKLPVAILGATGNVGQKFILLLHNHPYFEISELVASPRSAGKLFSDACFWKQNEAIPSTVASMTVKSSEDKISSKLAFSGLDSSIAGTLEERLASEGVLVISNAKNFRMHPQVPLVIPEINPDHFDLIDAQPWKGGIVTNSNCSTMFLAMALAPLHREFGIDKVMVTTMQAISGAGYPGVPSMDILGNVVPFIGGEEDKVETEAQKILGKLGDGAIEHADFPVSAQCTRVPVFDGHTEAVSFSLKKICGNRSNKACPFKLSRHAPGNGSSNRTEISH
jgi:aspartate-semialdehyde dehydrogenase